MKKTLLKLTLVAAAACMCAVGSAQIYTNSGVSLPGLHRGVPSVCDINNDGWPDLYIPGETYITDMSRTWLMPIWSVIGAVGINNGDGTFSFSMSYNRQAPLEQDLDEETVEFPAGMTENDDGSWTFNGHGLPPADYTCARWIDIDNDGNMDFMVMGEGADDWQPTSDTNANRYVLLYRNGGPDTGYTFSVVNDSGLLQMSNERSGNNAGKSSISVGDYDNDGYKDVVIQGYYNYMDGDESIGGRVTALFKNNGDGTFSQADVFNPLPYEECESPDGIYSTDIDDEDNVSHTPTYKIKPMTHGAVMFGDLNNDGWLDIVVTGYGDGDDADGCFYVYKNNGDGTFNQLDTSDKPFVPLYEADLAMADINGDGWLDIVSYGSRRGGDGELGKVGDIYLNTGDGNFNFDQLTTNAGNGLLASSESQLAVLDINHDGYYDVVASGWFSAISDWGAAICYGTSTGEFNSTADNGETGLFHMDSGGFTFGNLLDTKALNLVTEVYDGGTTTTLFNDADYADAETPEAPTGVAAELGDDGTLTVTWDNADPSLTYNVYVKNTDTGWISMVLPASIETGHLKTIQDMQVAIRGDVDMLSYSITGLDAEGTYEVGVQTVNPDATTSEFTKAYDATNGIKGVKSKGGTELDVSVVNGGVYVSSNEQLEVNVYNISGSTIATGQTNKMIPVSGNKVVLVKSGNIVKKVVMP